MSELVQLAPVHEALQARGGRLLAVSVDAPDDSRGVVERLKLPFAILCDVEGAVIRKLGLLHSGGGPGDSDIAIPAHILLARSGKVAWRHISTRDQDRPDPKKDLKAISNL